MTIPPKHLEEQSIRLDAGDYYQSPTPDLASRTRSSRGWRNMARTNIPLDPTKTGLEANRFDRFAESVEPDPRRAAALDAGHKP
jgi:hypothetical protein